ncbi:Maf family protein [Gilvimarinus xylanilyticus]|uniref:7-methyl-GTP pyrophosphatase n=1 Tax=Gilvimarinus xylanilyticus TaxID=2944139 RepID=A0A9X2I418_9GAMM|nr:Maf family nucleotide pyrophosphatase [Gilvimarinus xylanilyticus]MCP8898562.1 Maf family nucleotide pyrophosphatase [Gilvimarinus xylanilyticus]
MPNLVLASGSPYRRELLARLKLPFIWDSPSTDETPVDGEPAAERAKRLAHQKALSLRTTHPKSLIIGSDQVASLEGNICRKPGNFDSAFNQLKAASGREMTFHTGLSLIDSQTGAHYHHLAQYRARLRPLTDAQITYYLEQDQPYDCAGSFKCESLGISLFESLNGDDPNTLIGLPLIALTRLLAQAGLDVLSPPSD